MMTLRFHAMRYLYSLLFAPTALVLHAFFPTALQAQPLEGTTEFAPVREQNLPLPEVVVTAPQMTSPLTIVTAPKAPRQPVPAQDGADYLKAIPGFSVVRKGGSGGDPVLRGMAGSRLNITTDGQQILGGCGGRMDPPTAYIFPAEYDSIRVIKGPQTVLYGPTGSAGTVLFERDFRRAAPGMTADTSALRGSVGRRDEVASARYNWSDLYLDANASRAHADDYRDGNNQAVHSAYTRWSTRAALGWTPDEHTLLELSVGKSDAHAAYADRGMDGSRFARTTVALKFQQLQLSPLVTKLDAQVYRNAVDHVMDNYSMRQPGRLLMVSNPARITAGARVALTFELVPSTQLIAGVDMQSNTHSGRSAMGATKGDVAYAELPRSIDATFSQIGMFGELTHHIGSDQRSISGLRTDFWRAHDQRNLPAENTVAGNVTSRRDTLYSAFTRYERDLSGLPLTLYAGLGFAERFPDYWELVSKQSVQSNSAFGTRPEKTTQLDIGALYHAGPWHITASAFVGYLKDFILIQSHFSKPGQPGATVTRNVAARTWGGEIGATYALHPQWTLEAALSGVRGNNLSDHTALSQMPALESKWGITYDNQRWSLASLLRLVTSQKRIDLHKGTIAGQDSAASAGFAVWSVNGGWKPRKGTLISGGIDNLTNKAYAEHLNRGGVALAGYTHTRRVNEQGRMVWLKAQFELR